MGGWDRGGVVRLKRIKRVPGCRHIKPGMIVLHENTQVPFLILRRVIEIENPLDNKWWCVPAQPENGYPNRQEIIVCFDVMLGKDNPKFYYLS